MRNGSTPASATHSKWPLTGGVPGHLSTAKNTGVDRVYLAGYSDGSVWVCDATHPILSYICYIEGEVRNTQFLSGKGKRIPKHYLYVQIGFMFDCFDKSLLCRCKE